jgi:hypothetical protein
VSTGKVANPEVVERILTEIRFGVPASVAARAAGVAERTYYAWMAKGRDTRARGKHAEACRVFAEGVRQAEAYALSAAQLTHTRLALGQLVRREVRRVVLTDEGAHEEVIEREYHPPDARALQWWLERRAPGFYGAVVARDADTADPDEVMAPDAADDDPADAAERLRSALRRYAAAEGATPGAS